MTPFPSWIEPMCATLTEERFSNDAWIFEPKLDGERILAYRKGKSIQLYTRNHISANAQYPELMDAIRAQRSKSFILDGEVVALRPGTTIGSFSRLQRRMHYENPPPELIKSVPVIYFVFDLLYLEGSDERELPLVDRKRVLQTNFVFGKSLRFLTHLEKDGLTYYKEACRLGWEGLVAKRAESPYRSIRSKDWLKFKCVKEQEMVIGGYTEPEGTRQEFGALLMGYYADGTLHFAGKVGTGFNGPMLELVAAKLQRNKSDRSPFKSIDISKRGLHWIKPVLVAQIGYSEWTEDGKLRHPRFLGLRDDKSPRDVVREIPVHLK